MSNDFSNDNVVVTIGGPDFDAHGQAALLLVESLLHSLIEKGILSFAEAVEVVETAREVRAETGPELGNSAASLQKSLELLEAISGSLSRDIP